MRNHPTHLIALLGAAVLFPPGAQGQQQDTPSSRAHHGTILINSQPSGSYAETRVSNAGGVESTVENTIIFNRLGSKVEYKVSGVYRQDATGNLSGAHCEVSSSKSTVVTDVERNGNELRIRTQSGDKTYSRTIPVPSDLIGPEGSRRMMGALSTGSPQRSYQTFLCETGDIGSVTVKYVGSDSVLNAHGAATTATRVEQSLQGFPGVTSLWLDAAGDMLKMQQVTPFGPMETRRDEQTGPIVPTSGSELPEESYQGTMAVSNVRIPAPRRAQEIELRLTQRKPELGWPDFSDENQRVLERTADHVVLRITSPRVGQAHGTVAVSEHELANYARPTALLQSDDDRIIAIADRVTRNIHSPWLAALALQKWTADNMRFDTGIAVAPASELVVDRHGTCVGYSILLASLLRAAHLPSRIKMGYVYDGGVWGGHAWVEVHLADGWVPLDAAEYFPGPSDAARFSAVSMSGENGNLEGIGELARLYGNIDVQVQAFTVHGKRHAVPADAKGYTAENDTFRNAWLGVTVTKPSSMAFTHLDAHWPDTTLLQLEHTGETVTLFYSADDPTRSGRVQAEAFFAAHGIRGGDRTIRWGRAVAWQRSSNGASSVVASANGSLWGVTFKGANAADHLRQMLGRFAINDLSRVGGRVE